MKKYMIYIDDGEIVYKAFVPATSKREARSYVGGNVEVVSIKDVTEDYPISIDKVTDALKSFSFGDAEIAFITRCLVSNDIAK